MSASIRERLPGLTGAIFVLLSLFQLIAYVRTIQYGFAPVASMLSFLLCAVYMFLSIWLVLKRCDVFLLLALGALSLVRLFGIFQSGPNVFLVLHSIILFFAAAALLVLCLIQYCDAFERHRGKTSRLLFLPAALLVLGILMAMAATGNLLFGAPGHHVLRQLLSNIFFAPILGVAGYYCLALWFDSARKEFAENEGLFCVVAEENAPAPAPRPAPAPGPAFEGEGYCDLLKHVLLLVFTFGIWYLVWIYRTTQYLNRVTGEPERDPLKKLLLCLLVPFYSIYWLYRSAQRIDRLAAQTGIYSALSTFCLVTAFLGAILPVSFMQEKINAVAMVENGWMPASGFGGTPGGSGRNETRSVSEQLMEYKTLLDAGAITREDYDAKKKEILHL